MASATSKPELIAIVGPTAGGKSELAMRIAKKYNGEIISADSRSLYKGMDIGTAKASVEEQKAIKHWGLDLIKPNQKFSAKQFKDYALAAIDDIKRRNKLPIMVGGTGLYINSVIFDYSFESGVKRDPQNPRHSAKKPADEEKLAKNILVIGLDPGKERLSERVHKRVDTIVGKDFINEAKRLIQKYPRNLEAFKAPGYQPIFMYLNGEISLGEAKKLFVSNDLKLAKKQRTWFKRNKFILWHNSIREAEHTLSRILNT